MEETPKEAEIRIREQLSDNWYKIKLYTEGKENTTLVIELQDLAGRSLSMLKCHVDFGKIHYGPYPGKDDDKVYQSEREVYRALGKLAKEGLIHDIRIPTEEILAKDKHGK